MHACEAAVLAHPLCLLWVFLWVGMHVPCWSERRRSHASTLPHFQLHRGRLVLGISSRCTGARARGGCASAYALAGARAVTPVLVCGDSQGLPLRHIEGTWQGVQGQGFWDCQDLGGGCAVPCTQACRCMAGTSPRRMYCTRLLLGIRRQGACTSSMGVQEVSRHVYHQLCGRDFVWACMSPSV